MLVNSRYVDATDLVLEASVHTLPARERVAHTSASLAHLAADSVARVQLAPLNLSTEEPSLLRLHLTSSMDDDSLGREVGFLDICGQKRLRERVPPSAAP